MCSTLQAAHSAFVWRFLTEIWGFLPEFDAKSCLRSIQPMFPRRWGWRLTDPRRGKAASLITQLPGNSSISPSLPTRRRQVAEAHRISETLQHRLVAIRDEN